MFKKTKSELCKTMFKVSQRTESSQNWIRALCPIAKGACSGWQPSHGKWKHKGGSCRTWGWHTSWCYVSRNYQGKGQEFIKESKSYPGKYYMPCTGMVPGHYNRVLFKRVTRPVFYTKRGEQADTETTC